ncbi:MAG TPA: hypothetical protein VFT02_01310 [Pyrinomonadaceae bacterium]|nr:hypothetical protein [Pyrinomonadaceae bacterium]
MKNSRPQLINLLIGKSILETILVATIAVVVFLNVFPPSFKGWGEAVVDSRSIAGWAVNEAEPWQRVEIQLFIDGKLQGAQVAQLSRPDVAAAGWSKDEWHGYNFAVSELAAGDHEARVYALHRSGERLTLQLLGDPVRFVVRGDGKWERR